MKKICPLYGQGFCSQCYLIGPDVICPVWNPQAKAALDAEKGKA
jgi:hypothetical protein